MSRLMDAICRMRDVLENKEYNKLYFCDLQMKIIFQEVTRHLRKKGDDYSYELDFTAQDLRELAQDISDTFKRWDNELNPEKNIKKMKKENIKDGVMNLDPYLERAMPIMKLRRDFVQPLTELRSLIENYSVYLYFLEEASRDEFALRCTKRFN